MRLNSLKSHMTLSISLAILLTITPLGFTTDTKESEESQMQPIPRPITQNQTEEEITIQYNGWLGLKTEEVLSTEYDEIFCQEYLDYVLMEEKMGSSSAHNEEENTEIQYKDLPDMWIMEPPKKRQRIR
jgi:hypothetical protein